MYRKQSTQSNNGNSSRNARRGEQGSRKSKAKSNKRNNRNSERQAPLQQAPVSQSRVSRIGTPSINSIGSGTDARIRVRHKEYIADVVGAAGFNVSKYPVNPGLISSFPWLARVAANYESYLFESLSFHYEPTTSTSSVGSVILAMDFDAADANPATKTEAMSYHQRSRSTPWQEQRMVADKADLRKFGSQRYVRTASPAVNQDIKTYDVGNLFLCVDNATAATLGELHVSYDVLLMTPQLSVFDFSSAKVVGGGGVSDIQCFGPTPVITGALQIAVANNTITFTHPGEYLITMDAGGTVFVPGTAPDTSLSTCTRTIQSWYVNAAATAAQLTYRVDVVSAGQTFYTDWSGSTGTLTSYVVRIASYVYALA